MKYKLFKMRLLVRLHVKANSQTNVKANSQTNWKLNYIYYKTHKLTTWVKRYTPHHTCHSSRTLFQPNQTKSIPPTSKSLLIWWGTKFYYKQQQQDNIVIFTLSSLSTAEHIALNLSSGTPQAANIPSNNFLWLICKKNQNICIKILININKNLVFNIWYLWLSYKPDCWSA